MSTLLASCAVPMQATPSGRPEVLLLNTTPAEVLPRVVLSYAVSGEKVKRTTPHSATFSRRADDLGMMLAFGSMLNSVPELRTTLTLVKVGRDTQVFAIREAITNPNSAYESSVDVTRVAGSELQKRLEALQDE